MWILCSFYFGIIFFTASSVADSSAFLEDKDNLVQITLLKESSNSGHRARRATESRLPDLLQFGLPVGGENVVITLTKSDLLPTVTSDAASTEQANKPWKTAGVYTDSAHGSAMIVKKKSGKYTLDGFFSHGNKEWSLEPVGINSTNDQVTRDPRHRMVLATERNETISFFNDTVFAPQENQEQSDITGEENSYNRSGIYATGAGYRLRKRAVTQHTIEIAMIVDYKDYTKWRSFVGADSALPAMRLWYTFVAESINIRFLNIRDPELAMKISVTILKILTASWEATFISRLPNGDGEFHGAQGLQAFRVWYQKQSGIPASDHYILFTGYDIIGSSGISYSGRMCSAYSLSICENGFTGSLGGVAAHELGHSMSAVHDTDTKGQCSDNDQYIMSTVFTTPVNPGNEGNPWKFSLCSIAAFKKYLRRVTCTRPEQTSQPSKLVPAPGQRAGEVLSRNEQCVLLFRDSQSYFCQTIQEITGGMESLCGGMFCSIPNDPLSSCRTTVPQEFTECGVNKWCVMGQCVDKHSTATTRRPGASWPSMLMEANTAHIQATAAQSSQQNRNRGSPGEMMNGTTSRPLSTTSFVVPGSHKWKPSIFDRCNHFIYQLKSTEWWNCVKALMDGHRRL